MRKIIVVCICVLLAMTILVGGNIAMVYTATDWCTYTISTVRGYN